MWSLPSIEKLNKRAVEEHRKRKGRDPSPRGKKCESCGSKAKHMIPWHDPFGDAAIREIPKGYIPVCEECYDSGRWQEGYFDCESCGKLFTENYTWELYYRDTEDGRLCLPCAFKEYIEDAAHWLTEVPNEIDLDRQSMMRYLQDVPHVIGVETTYWQESLIFIGNAEFDSTTGQQISGEPLGEIIRDALSKAAMRDLVGGLSGEKPRCILLLDAGWQFAVSFGVYIDRKFAEEEVPRVAAVG